MLYEITLALPGGNDPRYPNPATENEGTIVDNQPFSTTRKFDGTFAA
jgi:hypothetical protein